MTVALQIRDVPDDVRDLLAKQARNRGQSMQAYLLDVVTREARLGAKADLFWGTAHLRVPIPADLDPVAIIREGRERGFDLDRDDDPELRA
jgi:hypothetical protein